MSFGHLLFLYKDGPLLYKGIAQGHTPASEKLPEGDRCSARERRREHVSSTVGRTTHNSSSRQTANPPPHNAAGNSSPGQSKVKDNTSEKGYRHEQSEAKMINGDEKGANGKSTSNGNTTDKRYSAQSRTPTREEWGFFLDYAQNNSLYSSEIKAALGDRYQVCLDHYLGRIQQRRSNQSTNI